MIVDLCKTDVSTPKGCHSFLVNSCHPFGIDIRVISKIKD